MVNVLKEIKTRVDASDRQFVLEAVERFEKTSDRDELLTISSEMFSYEKKYVSTYQGNCDVLISTVGMREAPIILSHLAIRPKRSILLHTVGSEGIAEKVMEDSDIKDIGIEFTPVQIDEVDAAYNYN